MGDSRDRAYRELRTRVVGGFYGPGFHLREEPLAREFGLSRTPVRAALRRLVEDGLATADAGQGIHVAEWSDADVEETFRLRILLEAHATELAVVRGGMELVERLEACNQTMADAITEGGPEAIASIQTVNRIFHRTLLAFAASPRLRSILEPMIDMPIVVRSFFLYTAVELRQSLNHHRDITIAARQQDGELGRRAMQLHLKMSHVRVHKHRNTWRAGVGEPHPGTDVNLSVEPVRRGARKSARDTDRP